jgi:hypothetical protein
MTYKRNLSLSSFYGLQPSPWSIKKFEKFRIGNLLKWLFNLKIHRNSNELNSKQNYEKKTNEIR